jgi:hypothetical protein
MGGGGLALAGVLFIVLPRQRKLWLPMLVLAVMGIVLAPMGCGGGGGAITGGSGNYGTPAGTYTFTITGANGSITGSTSLTVTVQ